MQSLPLPPLATQLRTFCAPAGAAWSNGTSVAARRVVDADVVFLIVQPPLRVHLKTARTENLDRVDHSIGRGKRFDKRPPGQHAVRVTALPRNSLPSLAWVQQWKRVTFALKLSGLSICLPARGYTAGLDYTEIGPGAVPNLLSDVQSKLVREQC